jgi:hypothetical protein
MAFVDYPGFSSVVGTDQLILAHLLNFQSSQPHHQSTHEKQTRAEPETAGLYEDEVELTFV